MQEAVQQDYPHLTPEEVTELADSKTNVLMLAVTHNSYYIEFECVFLLCLEWNVMY
jgi:hypothetical protein